MSLASAFSDARGRWLLAHCDPRVKLAWLAWISSQSVLLDSTGALAALLACAALPLAAIKMRGSGWAALGILIALTLWSAVASQGLFYAQWPRSVWITIVPPFTLGDWNLSGLHVYREGVWHGLTQSMRLLATTLAGLTVCLSTSPERILAVLLRLRVSVAVGFITMTALRFLPQMLTEIAIVRQAQRLRGARRLSRNWAATLVPVMAAALRKGATLSASVSNRGLDPAARRTFYPELRLRRWEKVLLLSLATSILCVGFAKVAYWLYVGDLYYASSLRQFYQFTRTWL